MRPMYETLTRLHRELGGLENEEKRLDEELSSLTNKKNEVERARQKIESKLEENKKGDVKLTLVNKTERIISSFYKDLAQSKCERLTSEITDIFNKLHHKKEMIEKIDIDPVTFDITLFDKNRKIIDKAALSSGELEIYAMSIVWALARISGQKLPFIIDTPLGRLDSFHRDNLLNLFFTNASHQMIIFSTDTEVTRHSFSMLKPWISRDYVIQHNDNEKFSEIKKGYFRNLT